MSDSVAGFADSVKLPLPPPIAIESAVEVEAAKLVSPPYCAVME